MAVDSGMWWSVWWPWMLVWLVTAVSLIAAVAWLAVRVHRYRKRLRPSPITRTADGSLRARLFGVGVSGGRNDRHEGTFPARCLGKVRDWNPGTGELTIEAIAIFSQPYESRYRTITGRCSQRAFPGATQRNGP
ncbi:hypothetical protein [Streptomyces asiaticus]